MALNENVRQIIEGLIIEKDVDRAREAAYRAASHEAEEYGSDEFLESVVRAYRLDAGAVPDDAVPEEISQLVLVDHPEETFDTERYRVTDQAERVANRIHAMRATAPRMRALGLPARNTTLLYGPPGTGKTEMARWIAFREHLPLVYVNMSNAVDSLMGRTAKNISQIFRYAHKGSCILMIDEIDCVANTRSSSARSADGELNRTTITLMQEIDRLPPGVALIAATNRMDMLDPALMRRFAQKEQVEKLPVEAARRMLANWAANVERRSGEAQLFSTAELDAFMEGYESNEEVTQAIVVQRAIAALSDKLLALPEFEAQPERQPVRAFRVIEPESNVDVTDDKGYMRGLAENEAWARPLRYAGEPDGFVLDSSGRLHLTAQNARALAPVGRFEVVYSRFASS